MSQKVERAQRSFWDVVDALYQSVQAEFSGSREGIDAVLDSVEDIRRRLDVLNEAQALLEAGDGNGALKTMQVALHGAGTSVL